MMTTTSADQTILSASAFDNSIGVNTHVAYAWGGYNNLALMETDLQYLGVTKLRDGLTNIPSAQPVLDGLAAAGYQFDLGVSSSIPATGAAGLQQYLAALNTFEANHPGSIIALEGLNEANIQPFSYNGSSSISAAAQFQTAYYDAIKGDAALSGIPVYNLTLGYNDPSDYAELGNLSSSSNYATAHAYVSTSTTPQAALATELAMVESASPGNPVVITETGYTTQTNTPYLGADQTVQAKSILNTLVDAFKDGVSTTYLYELLDQNSSSSDTNPQDHYGLFNSDGTPKLAATAVHNLTTILADNGTGGHQPTAQLGYTLGNLPASGESMVLGKSNGAYDLVVWAEPPVWNSTTDTEISNPTQTVTVTLSSVHQSINVYDPMDGTTPIASYSNVSTFTIPVSDHPVIIEIDAPPTVTVTAPSTPDVSGTAVQIVADLATLNASTSLSEITLTDTHVLPVASISTMDYLIANYGKALAAIQGGYSFSVTNSSNGSTGNWSQTQNFDSSGTLTSTTTSNYNSAGVITSEVTVNTDGSSDSILYSAGVKSQEAITNANGSKETISYNPSGQLTSETVQNTDGSSSTAVYSNGVETKLYVNNANGSHTNTFYNVTGQPYTTQILQTTAAGITTSVTDLHANGSLEYTKVLNADGSTTTTDLYNSAGQKTTEVDNYTDSSSLTTSYNTSGVVTQTVAVATNGSITTTNYSSGVESSVYVVNTNGSKQTELFTSGHLSTDVTLSTDGSSSTAVYANGVETALYVTNANGSHTNSFYDITGQAYATQILQTAAAGQTTSVTDLHANGSLEYTKVLNADGSTITDLYNSAGQKTTEVDNYTNGSSLTTSYNTSGVVTQTVAVATNGSIATTNYTSGVESSVYIANANGSKQTELFTSGHLSTDVTLNTDGSSSTAVYANGVETALYVTNVNGSHTNSFYNITGQAYTTQILQTTAAGVTTSVTDLHANGSLEYTKVLNADGSTTTDLYNSAGQKTAEVDNYTNGSSLTTSYNTSGVVTQTVAVATNGSITTTNYTSGVESSVYIANANGSKETELFASGHLTTDLVQNTDGSSSNAVYSNGVETALYVTNANGSHTNSFYDITGQAYTTQILQTTEANQTTSVTDLHANGSLEYTKVLNADGSTTTDLYNSAGQKTTEVDNHTDGSSLTDYYNTSGAITQTVADTADGNITTTNYTSGVESSVYIVDANGSKETELFTSGHLTTDLVQNTDGSSSNAVYSNGVETALYVTHSDGSHTNSFYEITGQAYTTQILQTTAAGQTTAITDLHADGSLEYTKVLNSGGSSTTDLYNTAGQKTTEIDNHTDGSSLTDLYNTSGLITQTVAVAADGGITTTNYTSGVESSVYITDADGSKETELFTSGQLTTDSVQNTNGSSSTTLYSDGAKTKMYVTNADGSHDNYYYNTTGVEHDSYNTAGQLAYIDILNTNGTHTETAKIAGVTLTGGAAGGDTFTTAGSTTVLYTQGNDQVTNFNVGTAANHDTIQIAKSLATEYSQLQITQSGADTLVHVAAGDSILLKNVSAANLSHTDFAFA
jgi:trimeric autotransporter adhesin